MIRTGGVLSQIAPSGQMVNVGAVEFWRMVEVKLVQHGVSETRMTQPSGELLLVAPGDLDKAQVVLGNDSPARNSLGSGPHL